MHVVKKAAIRFFIGGGGLCFLCCENDLGENEAPARDESNKAVEVLDLGEARVTRKENLIFLQFLSSCKEEFQKAGFGRNEVFLHESSFKDNQPKISVKILLTEADDEKRKKSISEVLESVRDKNFSQLLLDYSFVKMSKKKIKKTELGSVLAF